MLKEILPARYRQAVYAAYAVCVVVAGALAVAGVNTGKTPDVLAYLGGALGFVAAANTAPKRDEDGAADTAVLIAVLALILSVAAICGAKFG